MTNRNSKELIVSLILVILLALLANPFDFWMPDMMQMAILALVIGAFGLFASLIMKERVTDERESVHRMFAGRVAFLTGSVILTAGIVRQGLTDSTDFWLPVTLVAMILSKISAHIYSARNG